MYIIKPNRVFIYENSSAFSKRPHLVCIVNKFDSLNSTHMAHIPELLSEISDLDGILPF